MFPRDAYMICHYTLMYFVCAWTLRLIILRPFAKLSLLSVEITGSWRNADKSVQSFLEAIEYGLFSYMGYNDYTYMTGRGHSLMVWFKIAQWPRFSNSF